MTLKEENEYYAQWLLISGVNLRCMLRIATALLNESKDVINILGIGPRIVYNARQCGIPTLPIPALITRTTPTEIDNSWRDGSRGRKGKIKYRRS